MKSKNSIRTFLFKNYIVTIIIALVVILMTIFICNFIFKDLTFKEIHWESMKAEEVYSLPFNEIDTRKIEVFGGWIEILNENKKVIFVKGDKKDSIWQYDENMLFDYYAILNNNKEKHSYIYNIYPIKGSKEEPYLYIIKFPIILYYISIVIMAVIFLLLFFTGLYFYSKFTAKHIKVPIEYIMDGIRAMEKQNYKFKLDFYSENEFAEIRDAFNKMTAEIERAEANRKEAEKSKQRILMDISHDLKTPITSIQGFSKLIYDNETNSKEELNRYAKYIYDKSNHMVDLINDLFELSKLEDKNFSFVYEEHDIAEWLRRTIIEAYPDFEKNKINLNIEITDLTIMAKFDNKHMKRALNNLLYNIIEHNKQGTKAWIRSYKEKNNIIIQISDDGIGISENLRESIFEPFIRDNREGSNKEGTGLGLAITKKIIEKHGGSIHLSRDKRASTVFTIKLPIII